MTPKGNALRREFQARVRDTYPALAAMERELIEEEQREYGRMFWTAVAILIAACAAIVCAWWGIAWLLERAR